MGIVCLWSPGWSTGAGLGADLAAVLPAVLAEIAPRVRIEPERVWVDGRGLPGHELAESLLERLAGVGVEDARAGVAEAGVVAWMGARGASRITVIPAGGERGFLAALPLGWLGVDERVLSLLEGVGVRTCGELAGLEREAVEVRFGVEGVAVWRLARGEDRRRLFAPVPPERPSASLEFDGYAVTDPERLVFTVNALLGSVCDRLRERGEHARRIRLTLSLGNGETWEKPLRPARATASRAVWLRLVRGALERLTVPDAVAGVALEVESSEVAAVRQGDLFDRGFATASAVEAAMLRLLESQGEVVVRPEVGRHPLVERRTRWVAKGVEGEAALVAADGGDPASELSLRLLPEPRAVRMETARRRGSVVPARYRDGEGWREVVTAAGPDRISGGQWEAAYAREYYRAVTGEGVMVWLFRDAMRDEWYVQGWWD